MRYLNTAALVMAWTILVSMLTACAAETIDPTGNWSLTMTWGTGTCGATGTDPWTFTVTEAAGGNYLLSGDPGETVTGTVRCTAERCDLSLSSQAPGDPGSGIQSGTVAANLTLDANDRVAGSGTVNVSFTDGTNCSQQFTVVGTVL